MKLGAFLLGFLAVLVAPPMAGRAQAQAGNFEMDKLLTGLARPNTPAPIKDWKPSTAGEIALRSFAACAVKNQSRRVQAVIDAGPGSKAARANTLKLFTGSGCSGYLGPARFEDSVLRGAFAEQLYFASDAQLPVASNVALAVGNDGYALGACIAARDPAAADAFVRTERRSPAEAAAFARVLPVIHACREGKRVTLSGAEIHGILAEALYKMRGSSASGTN